MKKKYVIMIAIVAVLVVLGATTSFLKSISGTVVDAETGKPVEGAVVLVEWTRRVGNRRLSYGFSTGRRNCYRLKKESSMYSVRFIPLSTCLTSLSIKKGYVAWNNKRIFPDYKHRLESEDMYQAIKLNCFKQSYSHNQHISFIRTCSNDLLARYKKNLQRLMNGKST